MERGGFDFSDILEDANFGEKGIRFKLGTAHDGEKVGEFLVREFLPDEPVFR